MEYIPVRKRTRLQKALKHKKFREERKLRKKKKRDNARNSGVYYSDDDDDGDACLIIDKTEFYRSLENPPKEEVGVAKVSNFEHSLGLEDMGKRVVNATNDESYDDVSNDDDDDDGNVHIDIDDDGDGDGGGGGSDGGEVRNEECKPNDELHRRVFEDDNDDDGDVHIDIDIDIDGDDVKNEECEPRVFEDDFIGKRTRSHYKSSLSENTKDGTVSSPIATNTEESSSSLSSSSLSDDEEVADLKPETHDKSREVVKSKRDRPSKNKDDNIFLDEPKSRVKRPKTNEVQNDLMNAILENDNEASVNSVSEAYLPLKFKFGVENVQIVVSQEEQELECLFKEMEFALGVCDIGSHKSCVGDNEDDSEISDEKLCHGELEHFWILDDEIGIRCKICSIVKREIKYVTPEFNKNPFGRTGGNRYNGEFPYDNTNNVLDKFQFPDLSYDSRGDRTSLDATQGTVWDLIPGTKGTLYPHQQDAFEFIWKNIAGGIRIDELGRLTGSGTGGCIICHAPGTGKTRLAIVFLQSFMKKYPNSKPVILAPYSMLRTWEEEFARWNVNIPFYNLNEKELSGKEDCQLLKVYTQQSKTVKDENIVRMIKIDTWKRGMGVLAVSYGLFQRLANKSEEKDVKVRKNGVDKKVRKLLDDKIRQALLEQPDILVLDEGHTPRNEHSSIFKVLSEVSTKRRVMLTGTPFQNNFEELHNTFLLVREDFGVPFSAPLDNERRKLEVIRKHFEPFVHVHKGEILRDTLPGLFHSLVVLHPSQLQELFFARVAAIRSKFVKFDNLISVTSVHPSIFWNKKTDFIDKEHEALLEKHRNDLDAGVKTRFLVELIKLCKGERVLVFGQYLPPLNFIGDLLRSLFHWTKGTELLYMYGNQDMKERQSLIKLFNDPRSEAKVLLASTKTCCEGISLVGASRVILLDVVWNPSVERQAISRAYRLGQKKDVFVYHLITSGTIEEQKYCRQAEKECCGELLFSSSPPPVKEGNLQKRSEEPNVVLKDHILEAMTQHDKTKHMFKKIDCQHKIDDLITSFGSRNMQ